MLKERFYTGLVMMPLALVSILYLPTSCFALLTGLISTLAAFEWGRLAGLANSFSQRLFAAFFAGTLIGSQCFPMPFSTLEAAQMGLGLWVLLTLVVLGYRPERPGLLASVGIRALLGIFVLLGTWGALQFLHGIDPALVVCLFAIVWSMDIGAYFAGRRFGRYRLAPTISPGKTWEGLLGGLLCSIAVGSVLPQVVPTLCFFSFEQWLFITVTTALISAMGDLFESLLKRQVALKDSGNWLPGHGGILDRIDALTAAAPIFCYLYLSMV